MTLLSSCAYFNSLYNARKSYADAQRAVERGEYAAAQVAYQATIDRAARSLKKAPTGRWADDALLLMGSSYFARGDYARARESLDQLLEHTTDKDVRADALAHLGAVHVRTGNARAAEQVLTESLALHDDGRLAERAHLWRARARFTLGDMSGAWEDLERAARERDVTGQEARLERAAQAVLLDSARVGAAFASLLTDDAGARRLDTLRVLAGAAAVRWGAPLARAALEPAQRAPWPAPARDALWLSRAEFALAAGDTVTALSEARTVIQRADRQTAARASVTLARLQLAAARDLNALQEARATLLPALSEPDAQRMVHALKMTDVLLERAQRGDQPLAFFAAGELARDQLGALTLARRLFVSYADVAPQAMWAPKSLLAALALSNADEAEEIHARLEQYRANPYVAAVHGESVTEPFSVAEERLDRTLAQLSSQASAEANRRDAGVVHAVAILDSVKAVAQADSVRVGCGQLLDSLAIAGIRADSVRAACLRRDRERVGILLRIDTTKLRIAPRDTTPRARPVRPVNRDSLS